MKLKEQKYSITLSCVFSAQEPLVSTLSELPVPLRSGVVETETSIVAAAVAEPEGLWQLTANWA